MDGFINNSWGKWSIQTTKINNVKENNRPGSYGYLLNLGWLWHKFRRLGALSENGQLI